MTDPNAAAAELARKRVGDYQYDLMVYGLRTLSQALHVAALAMGVVFVLIWVSTDDAPGRLLAGVAGVLAAATLLWSSANNVPRPKMPSQSG